METAANVIHFTNDYLANVYEVTQVQSKRSNGKENAYISSIMDDESEDEDLDADRLLWRLLLTYHF